jgi:hypothetical protein
MGSAQTFLVRCCAMPPLSSALVLAADQPAQLAAFYGGLLECPPAAGQGPQHWCLPLPAGGLLQIYRPSRQRPQPRQPGRLALCLSRSGDGAALAQWCAQAQALGAVLLESPRQESFGWEAWLQDPEANRLLLVTLP